jgi:hypothetical protein
MLPRPRRIPNWLNRISPNQAYNSAQRELPQPRFRAIPLIQARRLRDRVLMMQIKRPILGDLVTHRRRFTTGHKHKQD